MLYQLYNGDALDQLRGMATGSADAIVSDPPAGIGFMGADWDKNKGGRDAWIAWLAEILVEARRVLKPGHYALIWALPRTAHWTATAIEDAGFEIRDVLAHLFGSGMPKHKNSLKPAREDWILARAPGRKNAPLNIDALRIPGAVPQVTQGAQDRIYGSGRGLRKVPTISKPHPAGRWPAHILLDDVAAAVLDQQSGERGISRCGPTRNAGIWNGTGEQVERSTGYGDTGGASRYFTRIEAGEYDPFCYSPKASPRERNAGCEQLPERAIDRYNECGAGSTPKQTPRQTRKEGNHHPTVKAQKLMRWLVELITPHGGAVLDMFAGSGSTGVAALATGRRFVGIERDPEYMTIARARLDHAAAQLDQERAA